MDVGAERWERVVRADRHDPAPVPCDRHSLQGRRLQDGCPTCGHVVVVHRVDDHVCSVCEILASIEADDPLVERFRAEVRRALA